MTSRRLTELLSQAIEHAEQDAWPWDTPIIDETQTFEDAGVLTTNDGLVVRFENGAEFRITVVQSRFEGGVA